MSIIRHKRRANFSVISNRAMEDTRLSIEARGLLAYLVTRPDDWEVQVGHLRKVCGCGRDRVNRMINELVDAGYAKREMVRGESAMFERQEFLVSDEPLFDSPLSENPKSENATLTKEGKGLRTESTKNIDVFGQEFREFYGDWPKKVNPGDAEKAFRAARKAATFDEIMAGKGRYIEYLNGDGWRPSPKGPAAWLRARAWENEYDGEDADAPAMTFGGIRVREA